MKQVQTPDGVWHSGASATYTATTNGTYTFKSVDNVGNTATQTVNVTKIGDKLWLPSLPPTTMTVPSVPKLSGSASTQLFAGPALSIEDNQESSGGWHVTAQATPLKDGNGRTFPSGSFTIAAMSITGSGITPAVSGGGVLDGAPITIAKATGKASGTVGFSQSTSLRIAIPARAYAGSYSTNVTMSLVNGP